MCLLTTYQMDCFYRATGAGCSYAWTRSHFLFLITSSLYYLFLQVSREQQNWTSSTWDIFKSLLFKLFVSSNFCIFLLLIIKTTTLYKVYNPKLRANLKQNNFKIRVKYIYIYIVRYDYVTSLLRGPRRGIVKGLEFQSLFPTKSVFSVK